ncbi:helix-turn-helix domain-containing protein [Pleionea sp. CnH1-48]|uniref:winged helix-turn-helix transcriptional regulator n=1 Tax=Pleionea sp. CnH1-48 TaxID=2954494 RepID=UPI0020976A4C|nr:helix-turn-helix domain-containing protein [Pleionea sp. CnH1-48]MCO7222847.1 helix-turn-helix transcriptional regulator [Pleionea sp. CnH1-48]
MTSIDKMRSACAVANGLEILGDRWTLLIIRDLMFTNRREFGHFLNAGEGISTNILSERLERLQCHGIISKQPHPDHGKKNIYELTDQGIALAPTMIELTLWALDSIQNTFAPPQVIELMKKDKEKLLQLIRQRTVLVEVPL